MRQNGRVPGTFRVIGTFRLNGRGLVAYGDVVSGVVSIGESLLIPLNSGLSIAATIRSVESIDGTSTASHVALVLADDDELESSILEGLQFAGETLTVEPSLPFCQDGDFGQRFDEAVASFRDLLKNVSWPQNVFWLSEAQIRAVGNCTYVYRPDRPQSHEAVRGTFQNIRSIGLTVSITAVGRSDTTTFAVVRPIYEFAQGEAMFVDRGVKIAVPATPFRTIVIHSRLRWWFARRKYIV